MIDCSLNIFVAVISGYVLTSVFFLKNPGLLHRKKNIKFRCRHISHRGGRFLNFSTTYLPTIDAFVVGLDLILCTRNFNIFHLIENICLDSIIYVFPFRSSVFVISSEHDSRSNFMFVTKINDYTCCTCQFEILFTSV